VNRLEYAMKDILRMAEAVAGGDYEAVIPLVDALKEINDPRWHIIVEAVNCLRHDEKFWLYQKAVAFGRQIALLFDYERLLFDGSLAGHLRELSALAAGPEPERDDWLANQWPTPMEPTPEPPELAILRRIQTHMGIQEETT
jgi:hypothetical protein